jgi:hypothetical protein
MGLYSNDPVENLKVCEQLVERAIEAVHLANQEYIKACKDLGYAKVALARANPHEWYGMNVYRIMGGEHIRNRIERGVVCFKDFETLDYGNPHIAPGSYYVLVDGKTAHMLNNDWQLDLL